MSDIVFIGFVIYGGIALNCILLNVTLRRIASAIEAMPSTKDLAEFEAARQRLWADMDKIREQMRGRK